MQFDLYTWLDAPYYHRYWTKFELIDIVHGLRADVHLHPIDPTEGESNGLAGRLEFADCVSRHGGQDPMLEAILKRKLKAEWQKMDDSGPEDTRKPIDEIVQSLEHRVFTLECTIADMKAKDAKGHDCSSSGDTQVVLSEMSEAQHRMLDNLLYAIVTVRARPSEGATYQYRVFQEMISQKTFISACGMTFSQLVGLAVQTGLVSIHDSAGVGELDLMWW